jgi:hypothetical protein
LFEFPNRTIEYHRKNFETNSTREQESTASDQISPFKVVAKKSVGELAKDDKSF